MTEVYQQTASPGPEAWAEFEDPAMAEGFTMIPNVVIRNPALSHGAFRLYSVLLSYAWQDGFCFPGQERLAADMGIRLRMVYQYTKELEAADLIHVRRRPLHQGVNKSNVYTFLNATDCNQPSTCGTDRQDTATPDRQDTANDKHAANKNSISPLSPPRGAESEGKEKAGVGRSPGATSSPSLHQPTPQQNRAGEGEDGKPSARRRKRSRGGTPEAGLQALRDHTHTRLGYNDMDHLVPLARQHDFTSDATPHWSIMKNLDNDYRLLDRIQKVVRRGIKAADVKAQLQGLPGTERDKASPEGTPDASAQATQDLSLTSHSAGDTPPAQGDEVTASERLNRKRKDTDAMLEKMIAEEEDEGIRRFYQRMLNSSRAKRQKEATDSPPDAPAQATDSPSLASTREPAPTTLEGNVEGDYAESFDGLLMNEPIESF